MFMEAQMEVSKIPESFSKRVTLYILVDLPRNRCREIFQDRPDNLP